jgi:hypothetical protein
LFKVAGIGIGNEKYHRLMKVIASTSVGMSSSPSNI